MTLVEGRLSGHGRIDRHIQELGELPELVGGTPGEHAGPGPDEGVTGGRYRPYRIPHIGARRPVRRGLRGGVGGRRLRDIPIADVKRHLHHDRGSPSVAKGVERPAHDIGYLFRPRDQLGTLYHRLPAAGGNEVWAHQDAVEGIAARQHQDRNVVGVGLGQPADRVLRARLGLHGHHSEPVPVADPRIAVGRHHRPAFVPEGHGTDALLGHLLDDRVRKVAGQPVDALLPEYAGYVLKAVQ